MFRGDTGGFLSSLFDMDAIDSTAASTDAADDDVRLDLEVGLRGA